MINISDKTNCSGCSACAAICPKDCIKMNVDEEGFAYPCVDGMECINCGACEKVCPIINKSEEVVSPQDAYVVQNKDQEVLRESTAGGAFTSIAEYVIKNGGVVFGVTLTDGFTAKHICVESISALKQFRNSKYMQSYEDGNAFKKVKVFLKQKRLVCYSGTPCQVEGLLHFLGKNYDNLITVDVVCRAVPSPMIFKKYIQFQNKALNSNVKNVRFRDKYYGYKYSTMNVTTETNGGNYHKGVDTDKWLKAFFSGMCLRPSCYCCEFKKRYRSSDFTIWDCFNVGRFSRKLDNDKGATRMLVHTEKGKQIMNEILNTFEYVKVEPEQIIAGTAEMTKSVQYNKLRDQFMQDANLMDPSDLFNKYFPDTLKTKLEHFVRMFCYRLGVYGIMKKIYVRITHKY